MAEQENKLIIIILSVWVRDMRLSSTHTRVRARTRVCIVHERHAMSIERPRKLEESHQKIMNAFFAPFTHLLVCILIECEMRMHNKNDRSRE